MTDDDLRARLRRADPAGSLPPLPADQTALTMEHTMSTTSAPRRPLMPALAAAALVLIAAGTGWALTRGSGPATPPLVTTESVVVELAFDNAAQAKCAEPRPERLTGDTDFVFAGAVTTITGDRVALTVSRVYKGPPASRVTVTQTDEATEQLLGATTFRTGGNYLIASSGGQVLICGYTGAADNPQLADLYERAF